MAKKLTTFHRVSPTTTISESKINFPSPIKIQFLAYRERPLPENSYQILELQSEPHGQHYEPKGKAIGKGAPFHKPSESWGLDGGNSPSDCDIERVEAGCSGEPILPFGCQWCELNWLVLAIGPRFHAQLLLGSGNFRVLGSEIVGFWGKCQGMEGEGESHYAMLQIVLRGEAACRDGWRRLVGPPTVTGPHANP